MNRFAVAMAAALVVALAPAGRGQQVVTSSQVVDPATVGGEFTLTSVDTPLVGLDGQPLARSPVLGGPSTPPLSPGSLRGLAGGLPVGNNTLNASVGFTYFVPLWSFRDFQLAAPKGFEPFFPAFGTLGSVDTHYGYAPRVTLDYHIHDLDLGVSASGTYLNLSGRIDRQQASTGGNTGHLAASSTLTLVSANVLEFHRLFAFTELFPDKNPKHQNVADSLLDLRIGTRYVSLDQNYNGALTGGGDRANITDRFTTQSFRGIGLTTGMRWTVPVGNNFAAFLAMQGSLLVGDNRRNSVVSASVFGLPGFTATQLESRTQLVPVTEIELGADWGWELGNRLRDGVGPPKFTVRVAAVGQYWGGLGPLSAGSNQGFRTTDLFLVGAYVQAGFHY